MSRTVSVDPQLVLRGYHQVWYRRSMKEFPLARISRRKFLIWHGSIRFEGSMFYPGKQVDGTGYYIHHKLWWWRYPVILTRSKLIRWQLTYDYRIKLSNDKCICNYRIKWYLYPIIGSVIRISLIGRAWYESHMLQSIPNNVKLLHASNFWDFFRSKYNTMQTNM